MHRSRIISSERNDDNREDLQRRAGSNGDRGGAAVGLPGTGTSDGSAIQPGHPAGASRNATAADQSQPAMAKPRSRPTAKG